jgi:hypothetical protein
MAVDLDAYRKQGGQAGCRLGRRPATQAGLEQTPILHLDRTVGLRRDLG